MTSRVLTIVPGTLAPAEGKPSAGVAVPFLFVGDEGDRLALGEGGVIIVGKGDRQVAGFVRVDVLSGRPYLAVQTWTPALSVVGVPAALVPLLDRLDRCTTFRVALADLVGQRVGYALLSTHESKVTS